MVGRRGLPRAILLFVGVLLAAICGCSSSADRCFEDKQAKALVRAIERGDLDEIDRLVADGADVNATGTEKLDMYVANPLATPLFVAIHAGRAESFGKLLEHGADPNKQGKGGGSPLSLAAKWSKSSEFLKLALKHGGDPDLVNPENDETPIFGAVVYRCKENIELLIEAGADLNHQDDSGSTPTLTAAGMNFFDIVYRFFEAGADYQLKSKAGYDVAYELIDSTVPAEHEYNRWRLKSIEFLEKRGVDFEPAKKRAIEEKQQIAEQVRTLHGR